MKTPVYSTKFNKDYKLAGKRGENIAELKRIMLELLFEGLKKTLPVSYGASFYIEE